MYLFLVFIFIKIEYDTSISNIYNFESNTYDIKSDIYNF